MKSSEPIRASSNREPLSINRPSHAVVKLQAAGDRRLLIATPGSLAQRVPGREERLNKPFSEFSRRALGCDSITLLGVSYCC